MKLYIIHVILKYGQKNSTTYHFWERIFLLLKIYENIYSRKIVF